MSDFEPTHQSKHPAGRFYGGVSRKLQNEIDGFDDTDPEQVLNRQDDERDNQFFIKDLNDDVATPCYQQDDDYTEDRFPAINENQRRRAR